MARRRSSYGKRGRRKAPEQDERRRRYVKESNGMGTAGFVVSLIGFCCAGILCPVGFFLSLAGINKRPNGLAISGAIIGGLGTLYLIVFGLPVINRLMDSDDWRKTLEEMRDERRFGEVTETVEYKETKKKITVLKRKIVNFEADRARMPKLSEIEAWGPTIIRDGWDRKFLFEEEAGWLSPVSVGPDGKHGTEDDIR